MNTIQTIDINQLIACIVLLITVCDSLLPGAARPRDALGVAQNLPQHVLPQYRSAPAAALRRR